MWLQELRCFLLQCRVSSCYGRATGLEERGDAAGALRVARNTLATLREAVSAGAIAPEHDYQTAVIVMQVEHLAQLQSERGASLAELRVALEQWESEGRPDRVVDAGYEQYRQRAREYLHWRILELEN